MKHSDHKNISGPSSVNEQGADVAQLLDVATDNLPYERGNDPSFWIDMLQHQVDEAREHFHDASSSFEERFDKTITELIDVMGVAWSAIHRLSAAPKQAITERTKNVIERKQAIREKYESLYGAPKLKADA